MRDPELAALVRRRHAEPGLAIVGGDGLVAAPALDVRRLRGVERSGCARAARARLAAGNGTTAGSRRASRREARLAGPPASLSDTTSIAPESKPQEMRGGDAHCHVRLVADAPRANNAWRPTEGVRGWHLVCVWRLPACAACDFRMNACARPGALVRGQRHVLRTRYRLGPHHRRRRGSRRSQERPVARPAAGAARARAAADVRRRSPPSSKMDAPKLENELIWLAERKLVAFQRPGVAAARARRPASTCRAAGAARRQRPSHGATAAARLPPRGLPSASCSVLLILTRLHKIAGHGTWPASLDDVRAEEPTRRANRAPSGASKPRQRASGHR